MEIKPQFKFIDIERAGKSTPEPWPSRSAYQHGRDSTTTVVKVPSPMGQALHVPACTINMMMRPRLAAMDEVAPGFSRTLAQLREPKTLAIGLYNRGLQVETSRAGMDAADAEAAAKQASQCALSLERLYGAQYERVVWFVASPSRAFKEALQKRFDGGRFRRSSRGLEEAAQKEEEDRSGRRPGLYSRVVTYLATEGRHTAADLKAANAPRQDPRQAAATAGQDGIAASAKERAVFEAFADWWLLAEPDFVIVNGVGSFGQTAASRRPHTSSVYVTGDHAPTPLECGRPGSAVPMLPEGALVEHEARSFTLNATKSTAFWRNRAHKATMYDVARAVVDAGVPAVMNENRVGLGVGNGVVEADAVRAALKARADKGDGEASGARNLAASFEAMLDDMENVAKAWRGGADGSGKMLVELPMAWKRTSQRAKVEL